MSQTRSNNASLIKTSVSKLTKPTAGSTIGKTSSSIPSVVAKPYSGIPGPGTSSKSKVSLAPGIADQYASNLLKKTSTITKTPEDMSFKIGDVVWVNGLKQGVVAFVGETKFAPGEWVGVHLDTPEGKNDGSVAGVRYFTCEPLRGVFSKASKLTTHLNLDVNKTSEKDLTPPSASKLPDNLDVNLADDKGSSGFCSNASTPVDNPKADESFKQTEMKIDTTSTAESKIEESVKPSGIEKPSIQKPLCSGISRLPRSNHGSNLSINQFLTSEATMKIGDRVVVGGSKQGTLKFIGSTLFAKGEWAGVELDEPLGKNDGSVEGKRYFKCPPQFGLFAPLAKVSLASSSLSSKGKHTNLTRTGSQESVSSLGSVQSSASRSGRVRLGVMSFANQVKPKASSTSSSGTNVNTSALEKALKEKEEHVEQLLAERDFERSEIARSETRMEEMEKEMLQMKLSSENILQELEEVKETMKKMEEKNVELNSQLEEERRKVEDLQFTMEEASIDKVDLESERRKGNEKLEEVSRRLEEQMKRANQLELELNLLKEEQKDGSNDSEKKHLEERLKLIEELNSEKSSNEQLNERLEKGDEELKKLKRDNEELINEVAIVKNELISKIDTIQQLETDLLNSEKKDEDVELKAELFKAKESLSEALKEVGDLKMKLDDIEAAKGRFEIEKSKVIEDLEIKCRSFEENEENNWKKIKEDLEAEKKCLERLIEDLKKECDDTKCQLSAAKDAEAERMKLEEEMKIIETKFKGSEDHRTRLESELQQKLKQCEEEKGCLFVELESIKTKVISDGEIHSVLIKEFEEKDKKHGEEKILIEKQMEGLKSNIEQMQKSLVDLRSERDMLKVELASKQDDDVERTNVIRDIMAKKESAEHEIVTLKFECDDIKKKHEIDQQEAKKLLSEVEVRMKFLEEQLIGKDEELKKVKTGFQAEVDELKKLSAEFEEERKSFLSKFNILESDRLSFESESVKLKEELQSMALKHEAYVEETDRKSELEIQAKESLEVEVAKLNESKNKLLADMDSLKVELSSASDESAAHVVKVDELNKSVEELKKENESLKEERLKESETIVKDKCKEIEELKKKLLRGVELKEKLENENKSLSEMLNNVRDELHSTKSGATAISEKLEKAKEDKISLEQDLKAFKEQAGQAAESMMLSMKGKDTELFSLRTNLDESNKKIDSLSGDLSIVKIEFEKLIEETNNQKHELMVLEESNAKLRQVETSESLMKKERDEIGVKLKEAENEINCLKTKLEESLHKELSQDQEKEIVELKTVNERLKLEFHEVSKESKELKETLTSLQDQMSEELAKVKNEHNRATSAHQFEVNKMSQKIQNLNEECDALKKSFKKAADDFNAKQLEFESDKKRHDSEKQRLESEIISLKHEGQGSIKAESISDINGLEKNTDLVAQIDFLNSVIVDIQRRNEKLQQQVDVLMNQSLRDEREDSMVMTGNEVAPRLFCDICDMFDRHDTDDCPKQSDCYNDDDGLPPSRHHGDPNMERPYCDICEVFGHSTEDCNDEQTF